MRFTVADGQRLQASGIPHVKKPNPVYLHRVDAHFEVMTREGLTKGQPGDYVAYDPISGDVWPVAASYVEQHYEALPAQSR